MTVTLGASSSVMEMVVPLWVPVDTWSGRVPKLTLTLSPSSSTVSWMASKLKVFSVSPLLKTRFWGTPE